MSLTFADFKAGEPARALFRKLGLEQYLEVATSWRSLRRVIVDFNDLEVGRFVKLARGCDGLASSGERTLLHAILFVADFAWLADELAEGRAWFRMDNVSGEWRAAVAACILQKEDEA